MRDIARRTGLSLATVSKYVNGAKVKPANEAKLKRAIGEVGYTVNDVARGLKTNRSLTVGAVLPSLNNLFMNDVISHMEAILRESGYGVLVCDCMNRQDREREAVDFLLRKRMDALLWVPMAGDLTPMERALGQNVPVVLLDRLPEGAEDRVCAVLLDNRSAALEAARRLIRAGHERIGVVLGPEDVYTARERLAGCLCALAEAGIRPDARLIRHGEYSVADGYGGAMALMKIANPPTAILATNYETTLGAVLALNEMGLRVPQDVSLIGFDGQAMTDVIRPQLTRMVQPVAEMGRMAAQALLAQMQNPSPGKIIMATAEAIDGASVAPPQI